jgi:hypothetical protein
MTNEKAVEKIGKVSELTLDELAKVCADEGVTVRAVCQLLAEGMKADIVKLDTEGGELSRTPDMVTRHKYMTSAMEVLKLVKKEVASTNNIVVNNINYSDEKFRRIEEALELEKSLTKAIAEDSSHRGKVIDIELGEGGSHGEPIATGVI